mmetsp:Transcript_92699/g.276458  ORF Transcript_92699/g.276458 Transcript_92699/m.276458 type:complete len:315 (+) Transcript_92699:324-1268(+)
MALRASSSTGPETLSARPSGEFHIVDQHSKTPRHRRLPPQPGRCNWRYRRARKRHCPPVQRRSLLKAAAPRLSNCLQGSHHHHPGLRLGMQWGRTSCGTQLSPLPGQPQDLGHQSEPNGESLGPRRRGRRFGRSSEPCTATTRSCGSSTRSSAGPSGSSSAPSTAWLRRGAGTSEARTLEEVQAHRGLLTLQLSALTTTAKWTEVMRLSARENWSSVRLTRRRQRTRRGSTLRLMQGVPAPEVTTPRAGSPQLAWWSLQRRPRRASLRRQCGRATFAAALCRRVRRRRVRRADGGKARQEWSGATAEPWGNSPP